jgi:hypothetical protein
MKTAGALGQALPPLQNRLHPLREKRHMLFIQ